jgi:hypothetical protein
MIVVVINRILACGGRKQGQGGFTGCSLVPGPHTNRLLKAPLLIEAYKEAGDSERRCQGFGTLVTLRVL